MGQFCVALRFSVDTAFLVETLTMYNRIIFANIVHHGAEELMLAGLSLSHT
jgi:hypothetical protein